MERPGIEPGPLDRKPALLPSPPRQSAVLAFDEYHAFSPQIPLRTFETSPSAADIRLSELLTTTAGYFDGKGWGEADITPDRLVEAMEALSRYRSTVAGQSEH